MTFMCRFQKKLQQKLIDIHEQSLLKYSCLERMQRFMHENIRSPLCFAFGLS